MKAINSLLIRVIYLFVVFTFACAPIQAQVFQEYLDNLTQHNQFSGSVLISKGEDVVFHKAFGWANFEKKIPATTDTKFRIASMTKQFTAMAIMILQDRGLLNIDDQIGRYLNGYPNGDKIKIKHLLTHTSGLYCFMKDDDPRRDGNEFYALSTKATYVGDIIDKYSSVKPNFAPGNGFKYCNYGYLLLAKIIENVTNERFGEFLRKNIWGPLGMNNTGIDYYGSDCAVGYESFGKPVVYFNVACVLGAADMYSTTGDLYKWHLALRENSRVKKFVTPDILKQIFTPVSSEKNGLGWFIYPVKIDGKEHFCVAHKGGSVLPNEGSVRGVRTMITRFVNDDVCVIVLSNLGTVNQVPVSSALAKMFFGSHQPAEG